MILAYFLGTFLGPNQPNLSDFTCHYTYTNTCSHNWSKFGDVGPRKVPKKQARIIFYNIFSQNQSLPLQIDTFIFPMWC